jgi:hypothetical protein
MKHSNQQCMMMDSKPNYDLRTCATVVIHLGSFGFHFEVDQYIYGETALRNYPRVLFNFEFKNK